MSSAKRLAERARRARGEEDTRQDRKRHKGETPDGQSDALRTIAERVLAAERRMTHRFGHDLWFENPIACIYNPLVYASEAHEWSVGAFSQ